MAGRLLDRDDRSLKERLMDFAKGSDNYSRMGNASKSSSFPPKKMKKKRKKAKQKKVKHV